MIWMYLQRMIFVVVTFCFKLMNAYSPLFLIMILCLMENIRRYANYRVDKMRWFASVKVFE